MSKESLIECLKELGRKIEKGEMMQAGFQLQKAIGLAEKRCDVPSQPSTNCREAYEKWVYSEGKPKTGIQNNQMWRAWQAAWNTREGQPSEISVLNPDALAALKNNQRQLDMDGVEVGVSRQALDELIAAYEARAIVRE